MRTRGYGLCLLMFIASCAACGERAHADSVRDIRPAISRPIAPRGSVMMIPLTAHKPGNNWPRTISIRLADDRRLTADVLWISLRPPSAQPRHWTSDPRGLSLRPVEPHDDTSALRDSGSGEGPYLIVRLPMDGDGDIRIGGRSLSPIWQDVPMSDPLSADPSVMPTSALPMEQAPDRPDVYSPFEYWRWVLLADRLGLSPPPAAGDELQRMAGEHYAALWRIGLARIAALSPRIASECRSMLTRTAVDRQRTVATWIADPGVVSTLLGALLDHERPDAHALESAVAWLEQQPLFTMWPEDVSGVDVQLAITSLRDDAIAIELSWLGSSLPPTSLHLEPGIIARASIARMPMMPAPVGGNRREVEPPTQTLRISSMVGGSSSIVDMPCGPRVVEARPPAVTFRPLSPPLTLIDVQVNRAPPADPQRITRAQIRRIGGRWEAFFECARIFEQRQTLDPQSIRTFDDLRGIEAVTMLIGTDDGVTPSIWLTVPEHDWPAVIVGDPHPDMQVHKRSFGDRWHCRIVLPEAWFSATHANPAYVAFLRSHGESEDLETGPAASPSWRITPGRVAIDLAWWDDLPTDDR